MGVANKAREGMNTSETLWWAGGVVFVLLGEARPEPRSSARVKQAGMVTNLGLRRHGIIAATHRH